MKIVILLELSFIQYTLLLLPITGSKHRYFRCTLLLFVVDTKQGYFLLNAAEIKLIFIRPIINDGKDADWLLCLWLESQMRRSPFLHARRKSLFAVK